MGKTVTAQITSVYDTAEEYAEDAANLSAFEADPNNPPLTNKVLDAEARTISFTITTAS